MAFKASNQKQLIKATKKHWRQQLKHWFVSESLQTVTLVMNLFSLGQARDHLNIRLQTADGT